MPDVPEEWRDDALAAKWRKVRRLRRVVTGALEIERKEKTIGSSLEAAPVIYVADKAIRDAIEGLDLSEICITSGVTVSGDPAPENAYRQQDVPGVAVVFAKARGRKCARSWRITGDVGSDPQYPDVSARDARALRELAALGHLEI
jgi:isoleucyl-tRNA synthetase